MIERTDKVREAAAGEGVDHVLLGLPENLYYFSGFRTMLHTRPTFVFIAADAGVDPILIAPTVDRRLIRDGIWTDCLIEDVRFWGPDAAEDVYPDHVTILGELIPPGSRVGIDGLRFDWVSQLGESLGIELTPVSSAIDEIRKIKDENEIALVRRANELSFEILDTVVPEVLTTSDSITEIELAAEVERHARARGADGFGCPTLISHGDKMLAPHSPPLDRKIGRDVPTRVVLANTLEGYTADVIRSYVIGDASGELLRREKAFCRAQSACFDLLAPGVTSEDLMKAIEEVYEDEGVVDLWGRNVGHGLGITIHEPPRIAAGQSTVFEAGMIVAIEPVLGGVEGMGTYAQCDCCVITEDGCEVFTPHERGLYIL